MIQSLEVFVKKVEDKIDFLTMCLGFKYPAYSSADAIKPSCPGSSQHLAQDLFIFCYKFEVWDLSRCTWFLV